MVEAMTGMDLGDDAIASEADLFERMQQGLTDDERGRTAEVPPRRAARARRSSGARPKRNWRRSRCAKSSASWPARCTPTARPTPARAGQDRADAKGQPGLRGQRPAHAAGAAAAGGAGGRRPHRPGQHAACAALQQGAGRAAGRTASRDRPRRDGLSHGLWPATRLGPEPEQAVRLDREPSQRHARRPGAAPARTAQAGRPCRHEALAQAPATAAARTRISTTIFSECRARQGGLAPATPATGTRRPRARRHHGTQPVLAGQRPVQREHATRASAPNSPCSPAAPAAAWRRFAPGRP